MKVIANKPGYFGTLRTANEEFDVPDDTGKASWFDPVEQDEPKEAGKKKAAPAA